MFQISTTFCHMQNNCHWHLMTFIERVEGGWQYRGIMGNIDANSSERYKIMTELFPRHCSLLCNQWPIIHIHIIHIVWLNYVYFLNDIESIVHHPQSCLHLWHHDKVFVKGMMLLTRERYEQLIWNISLLYLFAKYIILLLCIVY